MHPFGTPDLLDRTDLPEHGAPIAPPLYRTTSWEFPSRAALKQASDDAFPGHFYPRYGHPASLLAEARIAQLEDAEGCVLFASGMAAISSAFLAFLQSGDRCALSTRTYGGTLVLAREELPRLGLEIELFDPFDRAETERALERRPKLVHVETPANPTARVLDLEPLARAVHEAGAILSVDATFLPPPFQRTLARGADLAVHSATKFLGGHTDVLGGAVSGSIAHMQRLERFRRHVGNGLDPDTAWRLHRSLETLELRVRAQCATALEVARWLDGPGRERGVRAVHYPGLVAHPDHELAARTLDGFGAVFSFEVESVERAAEIYDKLHIFRRGVSLGGVESLVTLPADTSHRWLAPEEYARAGFGPGAVRLSIGLEPASELVADLAQALD